MPKFNVEHQSTKSAQEAFSQFKNYMNSGNDIQKLDANIKCTFNDSNLTAELKGGQFKADVLVSSNEKGAIVKVTVDIPFLLTPFKGKIQETLLKQFAKHLA